MILEAITVLALAKPLDHATADERQFLACVREHESGSRYHVRNGHKRSSSSGAYQFIRATWQGNAQWAKWKGTFPARRYAEAHLAPAWVQDLVALHSIRNGGFHHWHGTGCRLAGRLA